MSNKLFWELEPIVKKAGSSVENKTGSWRTGKKPVIIQEKCVRCGICWSFCPDACFKVKPEKEMKNYQFRLIIDYNHCKGCLICVRECPFNAIKVLEEKE